jgi:glycogen(starch) synthase
MNTMRILIVSEDIPYPSMGGLAKHALSLARALVRAGHAVDILGGNQHSIEVSGEEGNFGGRFFGELSGHIAGWKEKQLGVFMPVRRTWVARRFARVILRHAPNYDVIHYHGHVPNVARYIPKHVNFVQTRHDQGSDCLTDVRFRNGAICTSVDPADCASCKVPHPNPVQRAVSTAAVIGYRREVADSFRCHKTVFVSDLLRRNFARAAGPGNWGAVVHNFVDTAALHKAHDAAASLVSPDEFHVFIAAKLYAAKGIGLFLRELAPLMRTDMRISIAGDGIDEMRLRAEFESDRIRFLGWCTPGTTLKMAASANAIVVPSVLEESFGATTLEGLMLGKPTFALARGGTPELAIYAASPDQLRLHPDMSSLVRDLVSYSGPSDFGLAREEMASADRAVRELVRIYRLPAGCPLN